MQSFSPCWLLGNNSDNGWEAHEEEERAYYLFSGNLPGLISSPTLSVRGGLSQQFKLWRWVGFNCTTLYIIKQEKKNWKKIRLHYLLILWSDVFFMVTYIYSKTSFEFSLDQGAYSKSFIFFFLCLCPSFLCRQHNVCFCILEWSTLSLFTSVWMNLASQEVSGEKKSWMRIKPAVLCYDEVRLRNTKLRSLNELTYQAREESNLMQLLRALHIYMLHKQVIHIL